MIDYHRLGIMPEKNHIWMRSETGHLYQEHCLTRAGFDKSYSILYHQNPPTVELATATSPLDGSDFIPQFAPNGELDFPRRRRHIDTTKLRPGGTWLSSRKAIMANDDITLAMAKPTENSADIFNNGDGDELVFFLEGSGRLESVMGVLEFRELDYVLVPRGVPHRFVFNEGPVSALIFEGHDDIEIPPFFRNEFGQLKLEAPYCHRDFRRPDRLVWDRHQPLPTATEGHGFKVVIKRVGRISDHILKHFPFDVVGWDGWVYPIAFNIMDYQPRTGLIHLPPTIHTTFSSTCGPTGTGCKYVICSFVPRKVDYHPKSIPCPYNHSSPDCDEMLFYVKGNFTSRKGIHPGSISLHPTGLPHGPHPGAYEASIGTTETHELAVMMDTFRPLGLTNAGAELEVTDYHETWIQESPKPPDVKDLITGL